MSEGHTERLEAALDGRYRIERKLGEGGMASVYLAEDIKHKRNVALKILRPELAAVLGAERFLAEIQTTANLQHPHILPLFDSGEADGYLYYVMPYIDGETLREKLDREKQLGVDEAVRIARDVADALDYAHRAGVIHRDIKPGNILLHDGRPVVADFGIALAVSAAGGGRMTETGLSLGTPHYMSPEQASADRDLSARSDVYSLGCVLYEMLAGQPPHTGPSAQSILVHILTKDVTPLAELRHTVPPNVAATVAKAIEKLPADRFESAADFAAALNEEGFRYRARARQERVPEAVLETAPAVRRERGLPWPAQIGVGALLVALAAWGWLRPAPTSPVGVPTRVQVLDFEDAVGNQQRLAISPDGRFLVKDAGDAIQVRAADDTQWRPLPNTEGAASPSFSPDGRWIAFDYNSTAGGIARISIDGGPVLPVVTPGRNPHWGFDSTIVYSDGAGGLRRVPFTGGDSELLVEVDSAGMSVRQPYLLPNGKGVLFTTGPSPTAAIAVYEFETGLVRELVPSGNDAQYLLTGHLVYGHRDGALMGVPFDLETLQVTGSPVTLLPSLAVSGTSSAQFGVSESGTLVYATAASVSTGPGARSPLVWVDLDGRETAIPLDMEGVRTPRLSPSGDRIAYAAGDQIWIYRVDTGTNTQLTFEGVNRSPVWSPNGDVVYFMSMREGTDGWDAFRKAADGASEVERLWSRPGAESVLTSGTEDGRWLVVGESEGPGNERDISLAMLTQDSVEFHQYLSADWPEYEGAVSPNGRWMAYTANEGGPPAVFVRGFPDPVGQWRISTGTGFDPVWAPDGSALYFVAPPNVMKVDVRTTGTFSHGQPTELFPWEYDSGAALEVGFDVHPDGDRFLFASSTSATGFGEVYIVTNWFTELRERMGEN